MMVVGLIAEGNTTGRVKYLESTQQLFVELGDDVLRQAIIDYLTVEQEFFIPESGDVLDDYRVDRERPTKDIKYMKLALCGLWAKTGVHVDWTSLREEKE